MQSDSGRKTSRGKRGGAAAPTGLKAAPKVLQASGGVQKASSTVRKARHLRYMHADGACSSSYDAANAWQHRLGAVLLHNALDFARHCQQLSSCISRQSRARPLGAPDC